MLKHCFITIIAVLSALYVAADVNIRGRVTDSDKKPVEFVTVRVAGTAKGTMTDRDGRYSLSLAPCDTIRLIYSCVGYREVTRMFVDAAGDITMNVRMRLDKRRLKEVNITEYRKQTGNMQRINAAAYRFSPDVSGGSVESMVMTMAGVSGANELSSAYSVRGGSYDENAIYINGIEVRRPMMVNAGQQEGLSIINPDMVGAVEFSAGGFPAEYGDRMSSVLDITYRRPERLEASVDISLMGGGLSFGQSSDRFSQLHGVRYKRNNSLLGGLDTKGEYDPDFFDYQTNLNLKLNSHWKLAFLGDVSINKYGFVPENRSTDFGTVDNTKRFTVYFDGREKDRFDTWLGAVTLRYQPSRNTDYTILASGYLTDELVSYDITGEYWLNEAGVYDNDINDGAIGIGRSREHARNRIKASVFSAGVRGNMALGANNLSYGAIFNRENVRDRSREWVMIDSAGYVLQRTDRGIDMSHFLLSSQNLESSRLSLFIQDAVRLTSSAGHWWLNAGIRAGYWNFNEEWTVSPRVSVGFVPEANRHFAFRVSAGLYCQAPFYKEVKFPVDGVVELNRDIKSQRSLQFIFGTDYTFSAFGRPFRFSGEAYYKALSRIIPYEVDNLKVIYAGYNGADGYTAGIDLKLFGEFVPGSDSWISASLMKSQETLNGVKVPRPNDRRYGFAMFFTDYFPRLPKLKFNLRGVFSDGLPVAYPYMSRDKGYFRAPAYKRIDVGLSYALLSPLKEGEYRSGVWRCIKSVWLGVECFNLLDISNVSNYYWVTDTSGIGYAVPNYLTRRQFNVRLTIDF